MKTGTMVLVATWNLTTKQVGVIGQVRHTAADGQIGVALVNEGGRVDLWHPSQVTEMTPEAAARQYAASR